MKKQKILFLGFVLLSIFTVAAAMGPTFHLSVSYNSEKSWWENDCEMPENYTSIADVVDSGVDAQSYTTRGTITSLEGNSFFVQSRNRGLFVYTTSSSFSGFSIGNVVDVTGTKSTYYSLVELAPTAATLYADTNPHPVITEYVSSSNFATFCSSNNVGRLISLNGMTVASISGKAITFSYEGVTINGRISSSSYAGLTSQLTTYMNNSTLIDFTGILAIYNSSYQIRLYDTSCLSEHSNILVSGISVAPTNSGVNRGGTVQFAAVVTPSNAFNKNVTWSTSGGGTISASGLFSATTAGTFTITATAQDTSGISGSTLVYVADVPILVSAITVESSSSSFIEGSTYNFTASISPTNADNQEVTWSTNLGSINQTGVYTASAVGEATITATAKDGSGIVGTKTITVAEQTTPTEGSVVENPTLNGDVLGPIYSPGSQDQISFTYLEMVQLYGDSLIFDYGNFEVLVDGGQIGDKSNVMSALSEYVTDNCLEVLIVTHPHSDHLGGLSDYSAMVSAGITSIKYIVDFGGTYSSTVYSNYVTARQYYISQGATYYSIYEMVNNSTSHYPNIFNICGDVNIHFLNSNAYTAAGETISSDYANESSVCTLFSFGDTRIMSCGDLTNSSSTGGTPETYLIDTYGPSGEGLWSDSTTNIVKANHHCSNTHGSNSDAWINGLAPDYVFISAAIVTDNRSENNANVTVTNQHPNATSLARYLAATTNVYCNIVNGTTHFNFETPSSSPVLTFEGRTINYSYNGTIVSATLEKEYRFTQSSFYSQLYSA
ncbi:MAG TPA: Ig-like domain-containing protein [Bacilli bacterium]|nr:Ig-like domain-containing protein [Bacilli bacterium]